MGSFLLFHRRRVYRPHKHMSMSWEREGRKLMDLNNLLSGQFYSFPIQDGQCLLLPSAFRFVITLDSDTELPRGTAHRMVGALDSSVEPGHCVDPKKGVGWLPGYGICNHRPYRSEFGTLASGEHLFPLGLDIYTRAISDVYQDLYGEGSFVGKGIYKVKTLRARSGSPFSKECVAEIEGLVGVPYARAGAGQRYRSDRRLSIPLQRL